MHNRLKKLTIRLFFFFMVFLLYGYRAEAVLMNDVNYSASDPDGAGPQNSFADNRAIDLGDPYEAIVQLTMFSGASTATGTGVLVSPDHILTAKHNFSASLTSVEVKFFDSDNDGIADITQTLSATGTTLNDGDKSNGEIFGDYSSVLLDGTDVAVLKLNSSISTVTPLKILKGTVTGETGVMVGFGGHGLGGSTGDDETDVDQLRRAADNVIDYYGKPVQQPGSYDSSDEGSNSGSVSTDSAHGSNIYSTDFDDGPAHLTSGNDVDFDLIDFLGDPVEESEALLTDEGTTAPGDSGGPLLYNGLVAGVLSGGEGLPGTDLASYGDLSWWTGVYESPTQDGENIEEFLLGFAGIEFAAVPEPSTYLLIGSCLLFIMIQNQRKDKKSKVL